MKASPATLERQRRLVAQLRQRLVFETLVLRRMEGRAERKDDTPLRSVGDVLERAQARLSAPRT